jgi:antitoxin component of RelBE/YafQ-DinJ toxin-antitoxin module
MEKNKSIVVRVDDKLLKRINKFCKAKKMTVSDFVRRSIKFFLNNKEDYNGN